LSETVALKIIHEKLTNFCICFSKNFQFILNLILGNVELSSLNQARQFNQNGVYIIGNPETLFFSPETLSLSKLIKLEIDLEVEKIGKTTKTLEKKREKKVYTYENLTELKNILMLVARKTSKPKVPNQLNDSISDFDDIETLEYFIEIFDNVCRLGNVFIKLMNNGCLFFKSFTAQVFCDQSNKLVQNGDSNVVIKMLGSFVEKKYLILENKREEATKSLNDMRLFLENCLEYWVNYVHSIRDQYLNLNFFTTSQTVYLQQVMATFLNNFSNLDKFDEWQLYTLLSFIRQDLDRVKLLNAYDELKLNYNSLKKTSLKNTSYLDKTDEFINKIAQNNNFNFSVVKKAVDIFGHTNEQEIISYCIENDVGDFEMVEENLETIADDESNNTTDNLNDLSEMRNFIDKLKLTWNYFLKKQSEFHKDSLNLEQLAIYVELLKPIEQAGLVRKVPSYLMNKLTPNLVICPSKDQIPVVLSIYAFTPELPLPYSDEVLYCNSKTSSEEVENFFRIAFASNGHKIYCLVNIQDLSYENSVQVDKFLTNRQSHNSDSNEFCLVCICSMERNEQSVLVSSLLKHKVNPIILPSQEIKKYLLENFCNKTNPFRQHDLEGSCIRALLSKKPSNGKSMYVKDFEEKIKKIPHNYQIIRIKVNPLDFDSQIKKLIDEKRIHIKNQTNNPTVYHIDIAFEVFKNVDLFLFNLLIMGFLKHTNGHVWKRNLEDFYFIEMMPPYLQPKNIQVAQESISFHSLLNYLPKIEFRTPKQYLYDLVNLDNRTLSKLKDTAFENFYKMRKFQRTCLYLNCLHEDPNKLGSVNYSKATKLFPILTQVECLRSLLDYSELKYPNWAELHNFVNFLDEQLEVLENADLLHQISDLRLLVARYLISMAFDFGLPSLNVGEDSEVFCVNEDNQIQVQINKLEIARSWQNTKHPYIIFNSDRQTFTFMGIYLDRRKYKFIDPNTSEIMNDTEIQITNTLRISLLKERIAIYDNFNEFPRTKKINSLRYVMGLDSQKMINHDPDPTYELTLDNCLKMMAIHMRLRCNLPVVITGETGCGKTRLMKFFSDLHLDRKAQNLAHLIHFKIHGGITAHDIQLKLEKAEKIARLNKTKLGGGADQNAAMAILFFDEANTTEDIGLIKEIMCDLTCNGRKVDLSSGLKLVAAINPYRKHSDEMIKKLEEAGLGFYFSASDSLSDKEKLGQIPMRQLVYRVQPLPSSMVPLVWDFGQLDSNTERAYIKQMINKAILTKVLPEPSDEAEFDIFRDLLIKSQDFMREQKDECSFVSLRDMERVLKVTAWFFSKKTLLFEPMLKRKIKNLDDSYQTQLSPLKRSFVLALMTCYHSCLYNNETRFKYRLIIGDRIPLNDYCFSNVDDWVLCETLKCQHVFLDNIKLSNNIARNSALLENVFMMIVCIELRIPLFIGK
jgi:E3 ubiquitin-protein ligase RNF213